MTPRTGQSSRRTQLMFDHIEIVGIFLYSFLQYLKCDFMVSRISWLMAQTRSSIARMRLFWGRIDEELLEGSLNPNPNFCHFVDCKVDNVAKTLVSSHNLGVKRLFLDQRCAFQTIDKSVFSCRNTIEGRLHQR